MSALFNQTNITSGTPFTSGGGGSNFPEGITISANGANPNTLEVFPLVWGSNMLIVSGATQYLGTGDFAAGTLYAATQATASGNTYFTGNYGANTIAYQGSNGTGGKTTLLTVSDLQLGATANAAFSLNAVSSMTTGTYTANMTKLLSTMISLGYA